MFIGQIVQYRLTRFDAARINREAAGSQHEEGQVVPAVITRIINSEKKVANLRVLSDSPCDLWVPEVSESEAHELRTPEVGSWFEPRS